MLFSSLPVEMFLGLRLLFVDHVINAELFWILLRSWLAELFLIFLSFVGHFFYLDIVLL